MKANNNDLKAKVLSMLYPEPRGITATKLADKIGINERTVRRVIAELRRDGFEIENLNDGTGFFIKSRVA